MSDRIVEVCVEVCCNGSELLGVVRRPEYSAIHGSPPETQSEATDCMSGIDADGPLLALDREETKKRERDARKGGCYSASTCVLTWVRSRNGWKYPQHDRRPDGLPPFKVEAGQPFILVGECFCHVVTGVNEGTGLPILYGRLLTVDYRLANLSEYAYALANTPDSADSADSPDTVNE
ncbi:hypothetical protein O1611_g4959 [Lasiodiplodia mahajangana]|uniref:Uncharacterized protein n=1 Tax=Lasiodiplodia mahajangana TaxID=1108764 RepID=A0ACC2JMD5_9PEZI|nr:hypothetical protein O1611_g4959 [Lasiodiplodia mahajangana]